MMIGMPRNSATTKQLIDQRRPFSRVVGWVHDDQDAAQLCNNNNKKQLIDQRRPFSRGGPTCLGWVHDDRDAAQLCNYNKNS
jgi:hypothetical protein